MELGTSSKVLKFGNLEFEQEAMTNDMYQEIGKEFLKILTEIIKGVITGDLGMVKIITSVIKVTTESTDNILTK